MRHEAVPPSRLPQIVRGAVAQQQVRAGVAQETAEEADAGAGDVAAALPPIYADDTEAAANGIAIGDVYRSGGKYVTRKV